MSEYPVWYDENLMRDGILIIGVYFRELKDNFQNDARRWLKETLLNRLKDRCPEIFGETSIDPLEYSLIRYVSPVKKRKRGRTKGGEYKYLVRNATPKFYECLFDVLQQTKESGKPDWFEDYYIFVARRVVKHE